jgi:flagellar protein FlbD
MITLTRLSGTQFLLNADLIERVDSTPDTVITLVDGKKYVVSEPMGEVLDAVVAYRGEIIALGSLLDAAHAQAQALRTTTPAPRRGTEGKLASVASHPSARHSSDGERTGGDN